MYTFGQEGAEALAARASEADVDAVGGQAFLQVLTAKRVRQTSMLALSVMGSHSY